MTNGHAHTRLYLVRHCDVHNPGGMLYGHLAGFPLSAKGEQQAHALGRFFRETPARVIHASPLLRAQQTAEIIASHLPGARIVTSDDLVEARFGKYLQGVRPRDVPWRRPLWFLHMLWPGLLPNDESVAAMAARIDRQLRSLLRDHPGEGGICISHGDPIQAWWIRAQHRPAYALHRLQCAKGGRLQLDYEGDDVRTITYCPPLSAGAAVADAPSGGASHG